VRCSLIAIFRKNNTLTVIFASAALMVCGCGGPPPPPGLGAEDLPSDARASCTVTSTLFASWFQSGSVAINGVVNPANSVSFSNSPNCDFYKWSEQMFLWQTSPTPPSYGGGGGHIFDSPVFYDVSPIGSDGMRTLLKHSIGEIPNFALRAAQLGPNKLPVIMAVSGQLLEVAAQTKDFPPRVRSATGALVPISHARLGTNGLPVLIDTAGNVIETQRTQKVPDARSVTQLLEVHEFVIDGIKVFVDPAFDVVDVEQGESDGGVLEAQSGSLVYYGITVNDVYAYFLTGAKDGAITPGTQFPTTAAGLSAITAFAGAHGATFPDANALAIELKTSWIDSAGLANLNTYITKTATVPTYDTSNPNKFTPSGQKTLQLALVGIHVVGSTAGHPEMIWATFEHRANAPRGAYSYINASNQTVTVPQNTVADWTFAPNGSAGPFNGMHMQWEDPDIVSVPPFTISASDTIRWKAFGAGSDVAPNPLDPSSAASNTEIISINNSVRGMLVNGDVRTDYIMTGATWTIGGAAPNGSNQAGTSALANTTMETYQQGQDTTLAHGGTNCLTCHNSNTTGVSHVFKMIKPLF
jgi:hypothetical protein